MRKRIAIPAVLLALITAGLLTAGIVLAQEPTPEASEATACIAPGRHGPSAFSKLETDGIADLLGMTPAEVRAEIAAGKTLSDIAADKGLTEQQLSDALLASAREQLDAQVAAGCITQAQADEMLANLEARGLSGPNHVARSPRPDGIGFGADAIQAVADALGMTPEEIQTERAAGKTLADIATEKGVSGQTLSEALVAVQEQAINQALENGQITEAQAEWLLARAKSMAPFTLTDPFTPGLRDRGSDMGRRGGMPRMGEMRGGNTSLALPVAAATA